MRSGMPAGFDAWLTTDPSMDGPSENWEMLRRCTCGCWLKQDPDRDQYVQHIEVEEQIDGSIDHVDYSFYRLTYVCKRCKKENVFDEI